MRDDSYNAFLTRLSPFQDSGLNPVAAGTFQGYQLLGINFPLQSNQAARIVSVDCNLFSDTESGDILVNSFNLSLFPESGVPVRFWPCDGAVGRPLGQNGIVIHFESDELIFFDDYASGGGMLGINSIVPAIDVQNTGAVGHNVQSFLSAVIEIYGHQPGLRGKEALGFKP